MRRRLIIVLSLIVLLPLGAVAGLGFKIARDEREVARHQLVSLLDERLRDLKSTVAGVTQELERSFAKTLADARDAESLRALGRTTPLLRQVFVLDAEGRLEFPPDDETSSPSERGFRERTAAIWSRGAILYAPPASEGQGSGPQESGPRAIGGAGDSVVGLASKRPEGWVAWYWQEGLHLLYWRRLPAGGVVGAEVERVALLSRIVGRLPTSDPMDGRIVFADSRGDVIYQWGSRERRAGERASATLALDYPLDGWRLEYYTTSDPDDGLLGGSALFGLLLGLGGFGVALVGLSVYFYRESSREIREASQRVNFVTQVSHELKTPLTNIRLYAELLQDRLADDDDEAGERLGVIVSESQRLTRLINNILTFSKSTRGAPSAEDGRLQVDEVVRTVLQQFRPALAAKGIEPSFTAGAPRPVRGDADAVGQIVANLISNVEKYGAGGGRVEVVSRQDGERTTITVTDDGPGIPREHRARIFDPFYRASDRLTDGVTGTGIGLTIARELARASGGELALVDSPRGACFALELKTLVEGT